MPKVSDYELEHFDDEKFIEIKREKRKKPVKIKKYSEKKDYRSEWKKRKKAEESSDELLEEEFDDE